MIRNRHQLERYLAREVLGKDPPRKPPGKARRGPPRNPDYRHWISSEHPCAACHSWYSVECAHVGFDGGMAQKCSDYNCIPLCQDCHTMASYAYHRDREAFHRRFPQLDCLARAGELRAEWQERAA